MNVWPIELQKHNWAYIFSKNVLYYTEEWTIFKNSPLGPQKPNCEDPLQMEVNINGDSCQNKLFKLLQNRE